MKKNTNKLFNFLLIFLFTISYGITFAQVHPEFTITKSIPTSPVKNQYKTGTCWSFATISYIETEAIRNGKPLFDL